MKSQLEIIINLSERYKHVWEDVMKPEFVYSTIGNKFEVYKTKIVYSRGFWPFKKVVTIPISTIASIEKPQFLGQLIVETTGGKVHKFPLGGKANKAKAKIEELM